MKSFKKEEVEGQLEEVREEEQGALLSFLRMIFNQNLIVKTDYNYLIYTIYNILAYKGFNIKALDLIGPVNIWAFTPNIWIYEILHNSTHSCTLCCFLDNFLNLTLSVWVSGRSFLQPSLAPTTPSGQLPNSPRGPRWTPYYLGLHNLINYKLKYNFNYNWSSILHLVALVL